ncbi:uncharacterized protein EV422DRAFT_316793 [Fimicolochytrium jonesii]|uniref:uncharacterized protein n=1 Tax=Fimicolochytrium jonesii TaxID=1396493 RepID=UPI0022FED9C2|nr:uncharacterized protein EV422DRAFT_316793 [Fimicolochytrium jonesii]KAI8824328.1 hypothetical protein EV422DRAFT_316793 [Fimicolochytrium jonesii]
MTVDTTAAEAPGTCPFSGVRQRHLAAAESTGCPMSRTSTPPLPDHAVPTTPPIQWFDYESFYGGLNLASIPPNPVDLHSLLKIGDPVADDAYDALMAEYRAEGKQPPSSYKIFEEVLERRDAGVCTDAERRLLAEVETVPSWVDWASLERGREVYWRNLSGIQIVLLYGSLAGGFSIPRVNEVLVQTGYLSHAKHVNRRLMETAEMINDVMQHGLAPNSQGWKAVVGVRFLHCSVREKQADRMAMRKRQAEATGGSVDDISEEFGGAMAIAQTDLIGTLLGFQASVVVGLAHLWTYLTPQERDDYTHVWRYVGYLIGVMDEHSPLQYSFETTCSALKDYLQLYFEPDETSARLSNTLLQAVADKVSSIGPPQADKDKNQKVKAAPTTAKAATSTSTAASPTKTTPNAPEFTSGSYLLGVSISRRFLSGTLADALQLPSPPLYYRAVALWLCFVVWLFGRMAYVPGLSERTVRKRKEKMTRMLKVLNRPEA